MLALLSGSVCVSRRNIRNFENQKSYAPENVEKYRENVGISEP